MEFKQTDMAAHYSGQFMDDVKARIKEAGNPPLTSEQYNRVFEAFYARIDAAQQAIAIIDLPDGGDTDATN